jgi:hypothetical protein
MTKLLAGEQSDTLWPLACSANALALSELKLELRRMTPVGFEPTQLALVELESTPLDHSGKVSLARLYMHAAPICKHRACGGDGWRRRWLADAMVAEAMAGGCDGWRRRRLAERWLAETVTGGSHAGGRDAWRWQWLSEAIACAGDGRRARCLAVAIG